MNSAYARTQFGFMVIAPEATQNSGICNNCDAGPLTSTFNCRAWDATPSCCRTYTNASATVDDSAYLSSVLAAAQAKFAVRLASPDAQPALRSCGAPNNC